MGDQKLENTQKLMEVFARFHRLQWKRDSIEGLKPSDFFVLVAIQWMAKTGYEKVKISDVSRHLEIAAPTITQQLKTLEAKGLTQRHIDESDRRVVIVTLTQAGKSVLAKAGEAWFHTFDGLKDFLGEEDSLQLTMLLSKACQYFGDLKKNEEVEHVVE